MGRLRGVILLALCAVSGSALAQVEQFSPQAGFANQAGIALRADAKHTDNAGRTAQNTQEDTLASVGISGNYSHNGRKLDIDATGDLDWVTYIDNTYGSQTYGFVDASALWGTPSDVFQFLAHDTYGQARSDAFAAPTPDSVENVNNITAGPAVNLLLGSRTRVTAFGLYTNTSYQKSPFDSDRTQGGLSIVRALSESGSVSLNGVKQRVEYDDPIAAAVSDYETKLAYLRYQNGGARTTLTADAGWNQLDQQGRTSSGTLFRVGVQRRVSAASLLTLDLEQGYTAEANTIGQYRTPGQIGDTNALAIADPFEGRSAQLGWRTILARTSLDVRAFWRDERFKRVSTFDRSVQGVNVSVARRLRPQLTLLLSANYQAESYEQLPADNHEIDYTAELRSDIGRKLAVSLRYERYDRRSDQLAGEYTENQIGLRLTYQLTGRQ